MFQRARDIAVYFQNKAYFTKKGLTKQTVLHELYHHSVYVNDLDMPRRKEETAAKSYARDFRLRHGFMITCRIDTQGEELLLQGRTQESYRLHWRTQE